jgi:hypothetical protein
MRQVIRVLSLVVLIILAASGILAIFLPPTRSRFIDKEVTMEQVDKSNEHKDVHADRN